MEVERDENSVQKMVKADPELSLLQDFRTLFDEKVCQSLEKNIIVISLRYWCEYFRDWKYNTHR